MKSRGFTILEILIVITIMGILLVLGTVNMRESQKNGRDAERKIDIETISQHLETYYKTGDISGLVIGSYPAADLTSSVESMEETLRDISPESITAPNIDDPTLTFKSASDESASQSPTFDEYIYQPLDADNILCINSGECVKYNLFYRLETDSSTVQKATSRNQ